METDSSMNIVDDDDEIALSDSDDDKAEDQDDNAICKEEFFSLEDMDKVKNSYAMMKPIVEELKTITKKKEKLEKEEMVIMQHIQSGILKAFIEDANACIEKAGKFDIDNYFSILGKWDFIIFV